MNWFPLAVGNLDPYVEPGTHAITWAVHDNALPGYNGLLTIHHGDYLRVLDPQQQVVWEGVIDFDYQTGFTPYDNDPFFGCQMVGHQRVNSVQSGLDAHHWLSWFSDRYRAVLFRPADSVSTGSVSPLIQAVSNLPPERWAFRAPTRFFDGLAQLQPLERNRVIGDLQPAIAWIAHAFDWTSHQVAQSLGISEQLAAEWAAPSDLPWHRAQADDPELETRSAYLLALYAHLHWTLGEQVKDRTQWGEGATAIVASASTSFDALKEAVAALAPDPDMLTPPA